MNDNLDVSGSLVDNSTGFRLHALEPNSIREFPTFVAAPFKRVPFLRRVSTNWMKILCCT
ncbi:MAG: hypothetical protein HC769_22075 [Cyanobacteria bacterium CRU_2_1]|nr:hypothetical protein [Cyanobacteria bacterium RU_5_0]NJR61278.1 hypothetical protein [Cyanobacteria bacterium CRU_2_1]